MVTQRGMSYSVFGLQHNDHVWLEVWDDATKSWFPADAAYGVVGLNDVLGQPVNQAFRVCALATRRTVSNLVDAATWEGVKTPGRRPEAIETDAVEFGADKVRLFKLEG